MSVLAARNTVPGTGRLLIEPWFERREAWNELASSDPGATLYHDERWLRLLNKAYGFELIMVSIAEGPTSGAACVLARTKNPFNRRLAALPFSDGCPPLAPNPSAVGPLFDGLLRARHDRGTYEIRGVDLPPPWKVVNCFSGWKLDLNQSTGAIERRMAPHFRRQLRHAVKAGLLLHTGASLDDLYGFYRLLLEARRRQGVPIQPLRFFLLLRELFAPGRDFEVWSISGAGQLLAAMVILRSFGCLHYKWGARRVDSHIGVMHLLIRSLIENYAGAVRSLDLGRADVRNPGLIRFKREAGAEPQPLPYSFYPAVPSRLSPEVLSGFTWGLSQVWRRLPLPATRILSQALYRYLG